MAILKVGGVDFLAAPGEYNAGFFRLKTEERKSYGETISAKKVETVEIADVDKIEKIKLKTGWIPGGLFFAEKTHDITFIARFIDGRILIAATDANTYEDIKNSVHWNRPEL